MGDCAERPNSCVPQPKCPKSRPYSCSDGSCAEAVDLCPSLTSCPIGTFMCHNGQCVTMGNLCPTPVSCPEHSIRCLDGSCRSTKNITLQRQSLFGSSPDFIYCVTRKIQINQVGER